ncbi:MAG TPA: asparagine synthase (glutamine-hydrolyzing), partial [Candidatus Babeliaceae bacterium]|nr:asparagine synthase (glutamine-hydrolyzing) [Candidatus Babeliaceae bacterium]
MCGIAGYARLNTTLPKVSVSLLQSMSISLSHRGPDGSGIWVDSTGSFGLAHNLLSITGQTQASKQPMLNSEKKIVLCFNGEIYNHKQLRKQLQTEGYFYQSETDTETVLFAYEKWGIECLNHLEGMFAFAIADLRHNILYIARDRIGIKPLYFSLQGGYLSFASEIKGILQLPWIRKALNPNALSHYLTYMAVPAPGTIYQQIYKLPSGSYVFLDSSKNIHAQEWYSPLSISYAAQTFDENALIAQGQGLIESCIQSHLPDIPYAILLSGGLDSSLLVALAQKYDVRQLKTFTIGFAEDKTAEIPWAKTIAKQFQTLHTELIIDEANAFAYFQQITANQNEPCADPVILPLYALYQSIHQAGLKVALIAEGPDELFCGYSLYAQYLKIYPYFKFSQHYLPLHCRRILYHLLHPLFRNRLLSKDCLYNWVQGLDLFFSGALAFTEQTKQAYYKPCDLSSDPISEILYPEIRYNSSSYSLVEKYRQDYCSKAKHHDILQMMLYLELKNRIPELLLARADAISMMHSIESRVPFLHHTLVEFALKLPLQLKYKQGQTKYILKQIAKTFLAHDIIYRKKQGFSSPVHSWLTMGKHFKPYLFDMLNTKSNNVKDY